MPRRRTHSETRPENPTAEQYLNHLLSQGAKEGDSGAEQQMPPWYDERLFLLGQSYMKTYRFIVTSGMLTGLIAVLAIPSILRVLMITRQSHTAKLAYRRYVRTMFHTYAWYDYPPTDKRFWASLRTVRKGHIRSSGYSDNTGGGIITQKDLALTQFGFIGFATLGAPRIQMNDDDYLEGTVHLWRVLGYLLGIKDEFNICGANWEETKPRLEIVNREVFVPALMSAGPDFNKMTKALLDGLWPVNTTITVGSFMYFTKRLARVPGYEFFPFDYEPNTPRTEPCRYYELSAMDRFMVTQGLYITTYLHKFSIVRWYLNFRVWLGIIFLHYLPYVAFWKFGIKWSYVNIFNKKEVEDIRPEMHLHTS